MIAIVSAGTLALMACGSSVQDIHPSVPGKPWMEEFDKQGFVDADIAERTIEFDYNGVPSFGPIFEGVRLSQAIRAGEQLMRSHVVNEYDGEKVGEYFIDYNAIVYVEVADYHAEQVSSNATWFYLLGQLTDQEPTTADDVQDDVPSDLADDATDPFGEDPSADDIDGQGNQIDDTLSNM